MVQIVIGILMIASFLGLVFYCVKGYNLMVGFFAMSTLWVILVLVGNAISPVASMEGTTILDVVKTVYQGGPENYAQTILVNIFFGAFFGRVLMDTGIAATLIRKTVELGGDRPALTMILLCIVTAVCFTSMTGIGPVISIAVIVLPIFLALGIPSNISLFAFMGAIMSGILLNITAYAQYNGVLGGIDARFTEEYTYQNYFTYGIVAMAITLVVVLAVALVALNRAKASHAWAAENAAPAGAPAKDAPWYSWFSVILPVVLIVAVNCPIILAFILSALYALLTCGKLTGGFTAVCAMLARQFSEGAVDVSPMIGFLLTLSMFNKAAVYAAPYFESIIGGIFPSSALWLCVLFAVIFPLGFFRGPTTLTGCGTATAVVVLSIANWAIPFIYPLFSITTIIPQHMDLTQSWVAWGLGYTKVASKDYMRYSIPTVWIAGVLCCAAVYLMYGGAALA